MLGVAFAQQDGEGAGGAVTDSWGCIPMASWLIMAFTCNPIGCGLYWTRFELNHYFQLLNRLRGDFSCYCSSALYRPMNRQ